MKYNLNEIMTEANTTMKSLGYPKNEALKEAWINARLRMFVKKTGFGLVRVKTAIRASIKTMSQDCFDHINNYLESSGGITILKGNSVDDTENNINKLKYFFNGCFTCLQARAFAEYYHGIITRE